jgi:hypothetical protein
MTLSVTAVHEIAVGSSQAIVVETPRELILAVRKRRAPRLDAAVTAMLDRLLHHAHILKCGPGAGDPERRLP